MGMPPPDVTGARFITGGHRAVQQQGPMSTPDLTVVGNPWGPQVLPDSVTQILPGQVGYADLFSTLGPDGQPARGMNIGTYPPPTGALPARF